MMRIFYIIILVFFSLSWHITSVAIARENNITDQIWIDVLLDWHIKPKHVLELEIGPKTLISEDEQWKELTLTPAYEYSPARWVDLVARVLFSWVEQNARINTIEYRPVLGARFYFTQASKHRFLIRNFQRIESRNIYYRNDDSWSNTWRYRNRLEFFFSLNKEYMSDYKNWYLLADAELFVNLDETPEERFNDNWRFRGGIGYKLSFNWQFEGIYTRQLSRNTLQEAFDVSNNIFRCRFKYHW